MSRKGCIWIVLAAAAALDPAGVAAALRPVTAAVRDSAGPCFPPEWEGGGGGEQSQSGDRVLEEKTGSVTALKLRDDVLRVRVTTDIGNVRLVTQPPAEGAAAGATVRYRVRVEADRSRPNAEKLVKQFMVSAHASPEGIQIHGKAPWEEFRGRLRVTFEIQLPRAAHVDVNTGAGSIAAEELDGRVTLHSAGGNITVTRVGGPAHLETAGGHITVGDVSGDLTAITAGGHINAGTVGGDAVLRTLGGHIRLAGVKGQAQLETAGGNISVQRAQGKVTATSGGGRIDFGEVSGGIRARTDGGGIGVARVAGPTQLETSSGSIYLTHVQGAVQATTAAGGITAWFVPEGKLAGSSQLVCGQGDIEVYLPRALAITIDAVIESSLDHRIDADPALPLKISYSYSDARAGGGRGAVVRGEGLLNGGGPVLRLRTVAGNIRLHVAEAGIKLQERILKKQLDQFKMREMQLDEKLLNENLITIQRAQEKLDSEAEESAKKVAKEKDKDKERDRRVLGELRDRVQEMWTGYVPVNAQDQDKKLVHRVWPKFPDAARRERVEGIVWLEAMIDREGKIENLNVITGHPTLAQAAQEAVRKWRYEPTEINGRPVKVTTVIRLEFRLD